MLSERSSSAKQTQQAKRRRARKNKTFSPGIERALGAVRAARLRGKPLMKSQEDETLDDTNVRNRISVAETRRCTVKITLLSSLVMLAALISPSLAGANCLQEEKVARLRSGVGDVVDIQAFSLSIPSFEIFYTVYPL